MATAYSPYARAGSAPFEANLEHLIRCWEAEEENARRLASRANMLVTAGLAFLGVVVFRAGLALLSPEFAVRMTFVPVQRLYLMVGLLGTGLLLLVLSTWFALGAMSLRRKRPGSSTQLMLSEERRKGLQILLQDLVARKRQTEEEYVRVSNLYRLEASIQYETAIADLATRNSDESTRLGLAQVFLVPALACLVLALTLWVYTYTSPTGANAGDADTIQRPSTKVGE